MANRTRRLRSERMGCRVLGCGLALLAALLISCALAVMGAVALAKRANAQTRAPTPIAQVPTRTLIAPQLVLLVDQSGSIVNRTAHQRLAQQVAQAVFLQWQQANPSVTVRMSFFGTETRMAAGPSLVSDPDWPDQVSRAFSQSVDLGATEYDRVLTYMLDEPAPPADIVLITDGLPDPIDRSDDAGRKAYADLLRQMGNRLAERGTRLSVVLIGDVNRGIWEMVWHELANQTGGAFVEVRTLADLSAVDQAWAAFVPVMTATAIPFPTGTSTALPTLSPTRTRVAPTQTAVATPMRIEVRTDQSQVLVLPTPVPEPPSTQEPFTPDPSKTPPSSTRTAPTVLIGLSVLVLMLIGGVFAFALRSRAMHQHRLRQIAAIPPADEGYIEVYADAGLEGFDDADDAAAQRIELRTRVIGEVLSIGYDAGCDICLPGTTPSANSIPLAKQDKEQAVLILTPRGPVIEAREGRLDLDGRSVRQHLLFDGDSLSLNQCLLSYRNFFRQRPTSETDAETEIDN